MDKRQDRYHAYLLRIWHERSALGRQWRISLTDVDDHQRLGFASLEALFTFLSAQVRRWEHTEDDEMTG